MTVSNLSWLRMPVGKVGGDMKLLVMMRSKRIAMRFRLSMLSMVLILSSMSVQGGRYFVVVGTFSEEKSASSFAAALRDIYADAAVMYDDDRRLYYVHVMETDEGVGSAHPLCGKS